MMEHCKGCKRYMKSCSGMSERTCNKHKLRIPYTNADRIRSNTDEELAEMLCLVFGGSKPNEVDDGNDGSQWLEWLKAEVSE